MKTAFYFFVAKLLLKINGLAKRIEIITYYNHKICVIRAIVSSKASDSAKVELLRSLGKELRPLN